MKTPKPLLSLVFGTYCISMFFLQSFAQTCPTLVWQDEFNGTSVDPAKWNVVIGDGCPSLCGWGNNELQTYQAANVVVSGGTLKITARKETVGGRNYTSGRLNTKDLYSSGYGRYEARMKLPNAKGMWPAFWMLSQTEPYGTWPKSGEIDVMEFVPVTSTKQTLGYIHYGDFWPNNKSTGKIYTMPIDLSTDFHVWAVEWEANVIRWYIDGVLFSTKTNTDISPSAWPFDHPFYMLLNMAVGGNLGGAVTDAMLPATMEVDYVRVYTGTKPSLSGENSVANAAQGIVYTVNNMPSGTTVNWTVPSGATIVSGQGTNSITVNFGATEGNVVASYLDACTNTTTNLTLPVGVQAAYTKDFSFENFDDAALITNTTPTTGTFTDNFANPLSSSTVNNSALVGKYVRNAGEQYDVLYYNFNTPLNASAYKTGDKKFYLDVYTTAPIGTVITLQLETSAATAINYPTGRYARFTATTTSNTGWQKLGFDFLDSPDGSAASTVTKMVFLFNSNSNTGDTYHFDNFDSYNGPTPPPTYTKDFAFENFDAAALITQTTPTTGTFTDNFANPLPSSTVNNSALVGKYVRNAGEQYDVLYYNFNTPLNASAYKTGDKKFYLDVYTTAPIGTVITLQLETTAATTTNYPTGRYARFTATTTSNTGWQRLAFDFLDSPDAGAASTATKMVFLFNANSYTNDTYYFDNFDSYNNSTVATEPLTAAPTPTPLPANVISLFSNAYTNVAVDTWSAVWDVADVTDVQVAGNATKKYTNLTYAGVEFTSPTVNATTMERFHMDVWSLDAATFNVKLVDFGANGVYGGGDDTEHELSFSPTLNEWFSIDVPLSNFTGMTSRAHVAQLVIVGPGGGKTVWVDNVYFYKLPPTEPLTAAPTPTKSAPNVISLFSNPYTNVAVDTWSAVWDVADVTDVQVAGNATKKYTNLTYAGIEFTSPTVNATTMESFHMDVWSLDAATFNVKLVDFGANGVYGGGDDTEHELSFTPTLNEWYSIDVPLSNFTGMTSRAHVAQLIIVGPGGGKTVWVDNVYFYKTCQANGTLNDNPVVSGTYLFSSTITSQGKINAGSNVTFSAGNSVTLSPGFQANSSSVFSAQIGGCTN